MLPHRIVWIVQTVLSVPCRFALILFGNLRVRGLSNLNNLDTSKGVILASNHVSKLDSIIIPCSFSSFSKFSPVYFVALERKEYMHFPIGRHIYGSFIFKLLGAYSVKL